MKNAELIALMIANTNKTKNLRTYGKKWFSGARRICDRIATKVGHMIALIQHKIDQGEIINGKEQSLLVYNFQPIISNSGAAYVSFDMVIKPIEKIDETHDLTGVPIQLVVDGISCEVMNNARAMLNMGLTDVEHDDEIQNPIHYGNYSDYPAVCSYMTLRHHEQVPAADIFAGKYDKSPLIQDSLAFDSFVEARDYLDNNWCNYCMVAELNYSKEQHGAMLAMGVIGRRIIKLIHPHKAEVVVSNKQTVGPHEACVEDEVHRLMDAVKEAPTVPDFGYPTP